MNILEIQNLKFEYGKDKPVVDGVSFSLQKGECLAIVGPSGAGKSTLLRLLAGLETPKSGDVLLDHQTITSWQPQDRKMAMIFQNAALFPYTKVKDNITYGLKKLGFSKNEIHTSLHEIAELLHIEDLLERYPTALSGGEAQRVDIARALIRKPEILLLDEPLSSLDASLKGEMRELFKNIQKEFNMTMIMVTHDQQDAMALGDSIAIMKDGKFLCMGNPMQLYEQPQDVFTATFLGSPTMNLFNATIYNEKDKTYLYMLGDRMELPFHMKNEAALCGIRPEKIQFQEQGTFEGFVSQVQPFGSFYQIELIVNEAKLVKTSPDPIEIGKKVFFDLEIQDLHLFYPNSKKRMICDASKTI